MTYTPERIAGDGILTKEEYESALSDFKHEPYEYWRLAKLKRHDEALRSEIERLTARLAEAEKERDEARAQNAIAIEDVQKTLRFDDFQHHEFSWHHVQHLLERLRGHRTDVVTASRIASLLAKMIMKDDRTRSVPATVDNACYLVKVSRVKESPREPAATLNIGGTD